MEKCERCKGRMWVNQGTWMGDCNVIRCPDCNGIGIKPKAPEAEKVFKVGDRVKVKYEVAFSKCFGVIDKFYENKGAWVLLDIHKKGEERIFKLSELEPEATIEKHIADMKLESKIQNTKNPEADESLEKRIKENAGTYYKNMWKHCNMKPEIGFHNLAVIMDWFYSAGKEFIESETQKAKAEAVKEVMNSIETMTYEPNYFRKALGNLLTELKKKYVAKESEEL